MNWRRWSRKSGSENGIVEVTSGRISAVGKAHAGADAHDHGSGVILPALINAHTHLSLSCLSDRLRPGIGFVEWVKELIEARTAFSPQQIFTAAIQAADRAETDGYRPSPAKVGPWEPGAESITRAGLQGIVFLEMLGNSTAFWTFRTTATACPSHTRVMPFTPRPRRC